MEPLFVIIVLPIYLFIFFYNNLHYISTRGWLVWFIQGCNQYRLLVTLEIDNW